MKQQHTHTQEKRFSMKRSLAILLGVGVLTFTFVQCKTSGPDATRTASKPTSSTKSSSAAPAPVISSPADAAQATIAASQDFVNSSDPCQGLDAATCKTLTDAATQTAAADPNALAAQMTPENVTAAADTTTPTSTNTPANSDSTDTGTNSDTNVSTNKPSSSNTGAKVAVGLGVPIMFIGMFVGIVGDAIAVDYFLQQRAAKAEVVNRTSDVQMKFSGNYFIMKDAQMNPTYIKTNQKTPSVKEIETYNTKLAKEMRIPKAKTAAIVLLLNSPFLAGLGSMAYGASVFNSSTGLADGTTGSTPAQTYLNTLDAIGQQVVNNYQAQ